jgi:hypothetical protein
MPPSPGILSGLLVECSLQAIDCHDLFQCGKHIGTHLSSIQKPLMKKRKEKKPPMAFICLWNHTHVLHRAFKVLVQLGGIWPF